MKIKSRHLIVALFLLAWFYAMMFSQVRVVTPYKVHIPDRCDITRDCNDYENYVRAFVLNKLKARRDVIISRSEDADYILSFVVDKLPNGEEAVYCNSVLVKPPPTRYLLAAVVNKRKSKKTFEKLHVQSYIDLEVMANQLYVMLDCMFDERK